MVEGFDRCEESQLTMWPWHLKQRHLYNVMYLRQIILRHLNALLWIIIEKAFGHQVPSLVEARWHWIGHSGCSELVRSAIRCWETRTVIVVMEGKATASNAVRAKRGSCDLSSARNHTCEVAH
jgi:hypothetical protein